MDIGPMILALILGLPIVGALLFLLGTAVSHAIYEQDHSTLWVPLIALAAALVGVVDFIRDLDGIYALLFAVFIVVCIIVGYDHQQKKINKLEEKEKKLEKEANKNKNKNENENENEFDEFEDREWCRQQLLEIRGVGQATADRIIKKMEDGTTLTKKEQEYWDSFGNSPEDKNLKKGDWESLY